MLISRYCGCERKYKMKNKIWLITDTHFGHAAIKKWCKRPDNCDSLMLHNLSKMIGPGDVLIHLGDFCIGQDEIWHERFMAIEGKKWLIKGNHEHKSNSWYLAHGWDFVGEVVKDTYFGHNVLFSHIPQYWDGWYDVNVHGHFHTSDHRRLEPEMQLRKNGYQKLLAVEAVGYKPVTLESFIV